MTAATEFAAEVARTGMRASISTHGSDYIVTVERGFAPNDSHAYIMAECDAHYALALVPMTYSGSVWGTDSASVGGHAGLVGGYMRLSKSGVGARFAKSAAMACGVAVAVRS